MADENADVPRRDRPAGPELARVHDAFFDARGLESDVDWAEAAFVRLVRDDVRVDVVEQELNDAVPAVRDDQVDPEETYGPPQEWARERVSWLREAGLDVFDDALMLDVRGSVVAALAVAAAISLLLSGSVVFSLLSSAAGAKDLTLGLAIMPLLLGAVIMIVIGVYARSKARHPVVVTMVTCALTVIVGSMAIAGLIVPLGQVGPRFSGYWTPALVPAYAGAAWAVSRL